jgi:hypothetical protein
MPPFPTDPRSQPNGENMNDNDQPPERACANTECTSGEAPLPGYDDCETCAWEGHLERETAALRSRIADLESQLEASQDLRAHRTALRDFDRASVDESRTFGERNAARAGHAARHLSLSADEQPVAPRDVERDRIVRAMTDLLHCSEGAGAYVDEIISDAVRLHGREIEVEERETWNRREEIEVACPDCGQRRQQPRRWHEPCSACRLRLGGREGRISDDPAEANEQRALLVEDTLDAFAARTGQSGPLAHADTETCIEVLRDFYCNLGHWTDARQLDFDQIAADGRAVYREERAEADDSATA